MNPLLTNRELDELRDAVRDLLGLEFDDSRRDGLASALRERIALTGNDVAGYLRSLRGPAGRAEARILAGSLTVCETHFFRHSDQLRALAEVALPEIVQSRGDTHAAQDRGAARVPGSLRMLSAGCSSGDEAYSLAIVLCESFPALLETWEVQITGVDVNRAQLARARAARYTEWALREVPEASRRRWFHGGRGELVLDDRVRRMVTFEERNLVEDDAGFWRPDAFDVVFFRNVAMYFAPAAIRATIGRIARALAPGGFLFLGHAENLRGVSQDFQIRQSPGCFYYQLRSPPPSLSLPTAWGGSGRGLPAARGARAAEASGDPAPGVLDPACSWVDAIQRASDRIAALEAGSGTAPPAARAGRRSRQRLPCADLGAAMELVGQHRLDEALEELGELPPGIFADPDAELLRAALLTCCGRPEEAEGVCRRLLQQNDLDPGAHYLLALCREHAGDRAAACEHDRAAAHVDPGFAMPRLHLGFLAKRAGDLEAARRELSQAALLLEREEPGRILLFGDGFRREGLMQLCLAELRACGGAP